MALEGLSRGIFRSLGLLRSKRRLNEEELKEMTKSLRRALQEADFNVRQTKEIVDRLEERMREEEPRPGIDLQTHAMNILTWNSFEFSALRMNSNLVVLHFYWLDCMDKEKPLLQRNWLNGIERSMVCAWLLLKQTCIVPEHMHNCRNFWKIQASLYTANLMKKMRQPLYVMV